MKQCRTLLVIDDEILIYEVIKDSLNNLFNEIIYAENGLIGLEKLKNSTEIDCVICDIRMPVMDGVSTIKETRERKIETPFIFYTAYGDDAIFKEVAKYGIFDFLDKPKLENLVEVITKGAEFGFKLKTENCFKNVEIDEIYDLFNKKSPTK